VPRIALKKAEVGMQLARPVLNSDGAMLVDRGDTITQEMIVKLTNAEIRHVFVSGRPDDASLEAMLSSLEARFAMTRDEPHMERLRQLLREHLQEIYS
jgi:hypothetical protein